MNKISRLIRFVEKMNAYIKNKHGHINIFLQARYGFGIVYNYILYEATISDYFELAFYRKKHFEKVQYITSPQALRFAEYVDSLALIKQYFSKTEMYKALNEYICREQLFTNECFSKDVFLDFINRHPICIYKPDMDDCGHGIERWIVNTDNLEEKYRIAISSPAVLDELVEQCNEMSRLNPSSVNTVRLYSLIINSRCEIFAGFVRMGRNGSIVDNLGSGGLLAGIDLEKGIVITPATDDTGRKFEKHPDTQEDIVGFVIPRWNELLRYTKEVAIHYPMRYVGWDIAICTDGFQIIEANPDPMIHGIQTEFFGGRKKQYCEYQKRIESERDKTVMK